MSVEIRETIVTPSNRDRVCVQLHISDAPKNAEDAALTIVILATLPKPEIANLESLQISTIEKARAHIAQIYESLYGRMLPRVPRNGVQLHRASQNVGAINDLAASEILQGR